jgi:hypothetical protein
MATANGPDLSSAVDAILALMDDTCEVSRPAGGATVLDQRSGTLLPTVVGPTVYEGQCMVSASGREAQANTDTTGQQVVAQAFDISFPLTAPPLQPGDIVQVLSSRRDDQLVGQRFKVEAVYVKTFAVSRKVSASQLVAV